MEKQAPQVGKGIASQEVLISLKLRECEKEFQEQANRFVSVTRLCGRH
ncbi:hypothetical protein EZS27_015172 [termite gut metagenome]|uniref:Uncharacterized protein n=1 Tax=termite gut metagenome TaxID=433724 RepID=A0A5J4RSX8_9ZZZZ